MGNKTSTPQPVLKQQSSLPLFKWIFDDTKIINSAYKNAKTQWNSFPKHQLNSQSSFKPSQEEEYLKQKHLQEAKLENYYIGILNNNETYIKFANTYDEAIDKINKYNEIKQLGLSRNFTANNVPKQPLSGGGKRKQNKTKRNYRK